MELSKILAPWEYDAQNPPEIVSASETELLWRGEKRAAIVAILGLGDENFSVIRLEDDEASWWLCSGEPPLPQRLYDLDVKQEKSWKTPNTNQKLQRIFCCSNFISRSFSVYICSTGESYISNRLLPCLYHEPLPLTFLWKCNANFAPSQIAKMFESNCILHPENISLLEEFEFMKRWSEMSCQQRWEIVFEVKSTSLFFKARSKHIKILSQVMATDSYLDNRTHKFFIPIIDSEDDFYCFLDSQNTHGKFRIHFWLNLLYLFGPLKLNLKVLNFRCVQMWLKNMHLKEIQIEKISAHEKLEAKLQLLEWARENLPPDVLQRVLEIESSPAKL